MDEVNEGTPRILVVEDDAGNMMLLERFLASDGFQVVGAADGPAALRAVHGGHFDAVVLDLGLPGLDGLGVLARIRKESGVPVLVLSARVEEEHRLMAFDSGADDYVAKPYSLPELAARLRALLRRGQSIAPPERVECNGIVIDLGANEVTRDGEPIVLTHKEYELLAFLATRAGRTYSRQELLFHVWGSTGDWQDPATVTEHVRRLRAKLEPDRSRPVVIETVRGFGYRFAPAASREVASA
jgi:DNA-binding response OmpR family regulator